MPLKISDDDSPVLSTGTVIRDALGALALAAASGAIPHFFPVPTSTGGSDHGDNGNSCTDRGFRLGAILSFRQLFQNCLVVFHELRLNLELNIFRILGETLKNHICGRHRKF